MTTPMPSGEWLNSPLAVLARLAAPADVQAAYISQLGVAGSIDEPALEFDDHFRPIEAQIDLPQVGVPGLFGADPTTSCPATFTLTRPSKPAGRCLTRCANERAVRRRGYNHRPAAQPKDREIPLPELVNRC